MLWPPPSLLSKLKISSITANLGSSLCHRLNKLMTSEMVRRNTCKSYNLVNHFKAGWASHCLRQHIIQWCSMLTVNHGFMPPFSTAALFSFTSWIFKSSCTVGVDLSWGCDYSFNYWHFYQSQPQFFTFKLTWNGISSNIAVSEPWTPAPPTLPHPGSTRILVSWFP